LKIILFKLIFVLSIFLSACQSDTLIFIGEGEYWSAEVLIHQASGRESEEVMIRYKGDDLNSVGRFNYLIEAPSGGTGRGNVELNKTGIFKYEDSNLTERKTRSDAQLTITIEWKENKETIHLENR
jgi:hypothetical protein